MNKRRLILSGAFLLALLLPRLLPVSFEFGEYRIDLGIHHATLAALFVTMAIGLNLSIGFVGLLDLGFIAFVAIGAYTMAISLTLAPQLPWPLVLVFCAIISAAVRVALGASCLRLRGDYLAIVTLGFGEITRVALKNDFLGLTGGPDGIFLGNEGTIPAIFDEPASIYYIAAGIAALSCLVLDRWRHARAGRAWEAVREDEIAAEMCGVNVFRARIWAYGLGGVFAGIAGGLYAINNLTAHPTDYEFVESVKVVIMVVLGGMGSVFGVAAGSVFFILLLEIFRDLAQYRVLFFGAALVALMIWRPQGLGGRSR